MSFEMPFTREYAPETRRKDAQVCKDYHTYCEKRNVRPFPLNGNIARGFLAVKHLTRNKLSLEKEIRSGLFRLHQFATRTPVSEAVRISCNEFLRSIKSEGRVLKDPFIQADAELVISTLLELRQVKPRTISMILVAMYSGSRVGSMSEIRLRDITGIRREGVTRLYVTIALRHSKTKTNHEFTLEGDYLIQSTLDPVYWLNSYIKSQFGLNLNEWKLPVRFENERLWKWKSDAMSNNFNNAWSLAGYRQGTFSFHSLRKGLVANFIINGENEETAMRQSATIGGWKRNSDIHDSYRTNVTERVMIANRFSGSRVHPEFTSVNSFHRQTIDHPIADKRMKNSENNVQSITFEDIMNDLQKVIDNTTKK